MIDHLSLAVFDLERSRNFYDCVLATLGHSRVMDLEEHEYVACGYGASEHEPTFWIGASVGPALQPEPPMEQHIAFSAHNRATIDAFYNAALSAGGGDNGKPGLRPEYHPNYYATFVIDPDGYHIEAVCHNTKDRR